MNGLSRTVRSYEVQEVLRPLAHQRGVFLCPVHQQSGGCEMERITRRERRALRQLRFVTAREASLAARLAHLDYRVSNEAGALRVHTHSLTWHIANRPSGAAPPPGRGWERSGPVRVVKARGRGTLAKPLTHRERRRLTAM